MKTLFDFFNIKCPPPSPPPKPSFSREFRRFEIGLRYLFEAPIVVFSEEWGADIPAWCKPQILIERMLNLVKANYNFNKIELATDIEAFIYLYTASLAVPLKTTWARIYFHLARKYVGDKIKGVAPLEKPLDDYELRELEMLKAWIIGVQRRELKKKRS